MPDSDEDLRSLSSSGSSMSTYELEELARQLRQQFNIDVGLDDTTTSAIAQTFSQSQPSQSQSQPSDPGSATNSPTTSGCTPCDPAQFPSGGWRCSSTSCLVVSAPCWGCSYKAADARHCCCDTGGYCLISGSTAPPGGNDDPDESSASSASSSSGCTYQAGDIVTYIGDGMSYQVAQTDPQLGIQLHDPMFPGMTPFWVTCEDIQ